MTSNRADEIPAADNKIVNLRMVPERLCNVSMSLTPAYDDVADRPKRHYPTLNAKIADLVVHVVGLTLAITGGGLMLGLAIAKGGGSLITSVCIYAVGMITMLSASTAYNFAPAHKRPFRSKYDYAGIFLMIGASYTPFTVVSLTGAWSWTMTSVVWGIVGVCVIARMLEIQLTKHIWTGMYVALGWIVVIALVPMMGAVHWLPLLLLFLGGLVYTFGVVFFINERLTYSTAIWHAHVVAAAGLHWTAILLGVVIFPN